MLRIPDVLILPHQHKNLMTLCAFSSYPFPDGARKISANKSADPTTFALLGQDFDLRLNIITTCR